MKGESGWSKKAKSKNSSGGENQDAGATRAERAFFLVLAIVIAAEITVVVVFLR